METNELNSWGLLNDPTGNSYTKIIICHSFFGEELHFQKRRYLKYFFNSWLLHQSFHNFHLQHCIPVKMLKIVNNH